MRRRVLQALHPPPGRVDPRARAARLDDLGEAVYLQVVRPRRGRRVAIAGRRDARARPLRAVALGAAGVRAARC